MNTSTRHSPDASQLRHAIRATLFLYAASLLLAQFTHAQPKPSPLPSEQTYYPITTIPIPNNIKFEVSGLTTLPNNRIAAAIRKGDVYLLANINQPDPAKVTFKKIATALHEPLGLTWYKNALYLAQRSELTKLVDSNKDDIIDQYLTVAKPWHITGNYHEYAYGPKFDKSGQMWVTLNATIGKKIEQNDLWRGWGLRISTSGKTTPMAAGMRSPAGIGINLAGDAFFTDQQGNYVPTCSLHHLQKGAFYGHTDSLKHTTHPDSPLKKPTNIPQNIPVGEAARKIKSLKLPAVWFPYKKMGMGSTDIICDNTQGKFGPFHGQLFVGDFTLSNISRVYLEKVNGQYQGACFPFRSGFASAVVRMAITPSGRLFVGMTNRGWNSVGTASFGLQQLTWSGRTPFEILSISATPTGFKFAFTKPLDKKTALNPKNYQVSSYTYLYRQTYGSPEINPKTLTPQKITLLAPNRIHLSFKNLRPTYVHEFNLKNLRSAENLPLLHPQAYYTLNQIPKK